MRARERENFESSVLDSLIILVGEILANLSHRFAECDVYKKLRQDKRLSVEAYMLLFLWFAGHEA